MKVLVTGGVGYIGSHTSIELLAAGHEVCIVDDLSNGKIEVIERINRLSNQSLSFIKLDIRDRTSLERTLSKLQPDAVIHFAGLKSVNESILKPLEYYENNVYGSMQLFKIMSDFDVKNIIFSSSATVYGEPLTLPLKESMQTGIPTNPYGMSKLMVENILDDIYKGDNSWSIVRLRYFNPVGAHPSGLIGEDPKGIPSNLMPFICQVASGERKELKIFGSDYDTTDGYCIRDFIHVSDLAKGHLSALDKCLKHGSNDIYNVGTGQGISVFELVKTFEEVNNLALNYSVTKRRHGDVAACFADVEKIKNELKWEARYDTRKMCLDAWRWQTSNPQGY